MNGERYRSDSEVIASYALKFAKTVGVGNDGKDVWVFDIDETLLLNLPYYAGLGYGGDADQGKTATLYKSEKRQELIDEGYRIHGNSGDQWSDLNGFATGERSFKLPNPLYYTA
ncbi:acid phosphatase 1-like protein [Tanacetum coccineum]